MQINSNTLLKLKTTRLILKEALNYTMTDIERKMYDEISEEEMKLIRRHFLANIRNGILEVDLLKEFLIELTTQEYKRYLDNEGKYHDISKQVMVYEELTQRRDKKFEELSGYHYQQKIITKQ